MDARILKDLDDRAAHASDDAERLIIRAERAGVLARLGRIQPARAELVELRRINSAYQPKLSAWILFAEGLIEYSESISPGALDRFQRAHAISASIGDARLRIESAAWIAYCEYQFGDTPRAFAKALEVVAQSSASDHLARARSHLVLGDCLNSSEAREDALSHYAKARWHAAEIGDIAMQSVILHNQAADDLARLSLGNSLNIHVGVDVRSVELLIGSAANLDRGAGLTTVPNAVAILRAQLAVVKGDWEDGVRLYDAHLDVALEEGHARYKAKFLAERALCAAKLNDVTRSVSDVQAASAAIDPSSDPDDLAITHGRLAETHRVLGDETSCQQHTRLAQQFLEAFRDQQARHRAKILIIQNGETGKKEPG